MSIADGHADTSPVAGWYPDPHVPGAHRWWDGATWTEHTREEPAPAPVATAPAASLGYPHQGTSQYPAAPTGDPQQASPYSTPSAPHQQYPAQQYPAQQYPAQQYPAQQYPAQQQYPSVQQYPAQPAGYPAVGTVPGYPAATGASAYPSGAGRAAGGFGTTTTYPAPSWSGAATDPFAQPKNGLATWALVAGILVLVVLLFLDYAVVSGIAIVVGVRAVNKARAIKAEGYPKAVGMGRAVTGLVLSGIGALLFLLSWVLPA